MTQQIKVERIFINDTNKDGAPLINKNGEPYKRAVLYSTVSNGVTEATGVSGVTGATRLSSMSMYLAKDAPELAIIQTWEEGDEVSVETEKVQGSNGQTYTNFCLPASSASQNPQSSQSSQNPQDFQDLIIRVAKLENKIARAEERIDKMAKWAAERGPILDTLNKAR